MPEPAQFASRVDEELVLNYFPWANSMVDAARTGSSPTAPVQASIPLLALRSPQAVSRRFDQPSQPYSTS